MNCNALVYAFYKYVQSIDVNIATKITNTFNDIENICYEKSYQIAINKSDFDKSISKVYKLMNIFSDSSFVKFEELKFDKNFYIRDKENKSDISKEYWDEYINKVINAIKKYKDNYNKLYYILLKYLNNVPAINKDKYKISLFDICKLTSAIYNCLEKGTEECILIKGDLSGIQKFIFKTDTSDALKTLKGRSLYLSLLQDLCAKRIVGELELDITNILYCGGGNFYILASGINEEKFKEVKKKISTILLRAHNDEIYMALAFTKFNIKSLNTNIKEIWKDINEEISKVKDKRWSELDLKQIFGPLDKGGKLEQSCKVCGKISDILNEGKCEFCSSFVKLIQGAKESYFERDLKQIQVKNTYNTYNDVFEALGYDINFKINKQCIKYSINKFEEDADGVLFKSIKVPKNKSLDDITISDNTLGDNNLGVIKLDVDNLGSLFIQTTDLGMIMGLSRNISMFFEGYIESALYNNYFPLTNNGETERWKDKICIIYAGGDDTFVVGRYDETFKFAEALRSMFGKYVNNENRTFSAGVGMFNSNYPILMCANLVEDYLDKAKQYSYKLNDELKTKNSICFMGEVFSWKQFNELRKFKDKIEVIFARTQNRNLFEKISKSTRGFKAVFKDGKSINYLKLYRLAYFLRDLKTRENSELIEDLVSTYEKLCINALKDGTAKNTAMIIPYANKWARCNCRNLNKEGK